MKEETLQRWMEWADEHEKPIMVVMGIGTLITGLALHCLIVNGGKFFDWLMTPVAYVGYVLDWFCGC